MFRDDRQETACVRIPLPGASLPVALVAALLGAPAGAEDPKPDDKAGAESGSGVPAGHSYHGEAFNEGPRQKAYLMGTTGKVHFPVTTVVPAAQEFFDQGVGQLHGFWYFEAERSFRQVAALDPECRMAYWGMAMANFENRKRAQGLIEKAVEGKSEVTRREQMWIDGLAAFLKEDSRKKKDRRRRYIRSLEEIIHEFPDETEAKAFLAVRIWQFKGDLPIASHQAVDALIQQVFDVEPMHPAHHYKIHLWDYEKPERALPSAARCGQASPGIAHMWHMPGHIFSRLKRYDDAAWQQEASARVDHAHMVRDRVLPDQIHNYAHNNEWLIRNLSHIGRVHDAVDLAKNMIELPRHPKYNTLRRRGRSASYGRARLFDLLERFELWEEMLRLLDSPYLEPTDIPRERTKHARARAVACFETGDRDGLEAQIELLETRARGQRRARDAERDQAAAKARDEGRSDEEIEKARKGAGSGFDRNVRGIERALEELWCYRALLAGDTDAGREKLGKLEGIEKPRLARLHLRAGDAEKAEELAREAADSSEGQVVPLATLVEVLYRSGKSEEAVEALGTLGEISSSVDLDVPMFRRISAISGDLGVGGDWRAEPVVRDDIGERPDLDRLGPFRWHPYPAPPWRLPGPDGRYLSLSDYRARPVIVIFYLGYGCLHCVEQLGAFGPRASDFASIGIPLVAISTDGPKDLERSLVAFEEEGRFPFPLVSDPELDVFKEYRAFDDFEDQPLHGTFLIDGEGMVRWQDISYDPFMEVDFLIDEALRLLGRSRRRTRL